MTRRGGPFKTMETTFGRCRVFSASTREFAAACRVLRPHASHPTLDPMRRARALSITVFSRVVRSAANVAPGGDGSFDGKRIRDGDIAAPRTEQDHRHR